MRLLVIEDDATLRESLCRQLRDAGFGIEQAADGKEGLYFALEYPVDLAIVDLGLPEISGIDLIKEVRDKGKVYPILILTARPFLPPFVEARMDFLHKGMDVDAAAVFDRSGFKKQIHQHGFSASRRAINIQPLWSIGGPAI